MGLTPPLTIWAVSDGRAGIEGQVLGVAEAVQARVKAELVAKRIGWKAFLDPLPPLMNPAPSWGRSSGSSVFDPPWPDLWIAAGRASLPLSVRMRRRSGGRTFVVQLQDPRVPARCFDLVAPPAHDRLAGEGVFAITGAPHRVTPARLAAARARFAAQLEPLPRPRVAVLVGGKSKAFDLPERRARTLADDVGAAIEEAGGSLLLTFSRRTPAAARAAMSARLGVLPGIIYDGVGENPYFAFLAAADYVIVTKDSVNMVAEAASTGRPIFIADVEGEQWRKRLFHADLAARGAARPFEGRLYPFAYAPLRETDRLAEEIVRRLDERRAAEPGNLSRT